MFATLFASRAKKNKLLSVAVNKSRVGPSSPDSSDRSKKPAGGPAKIRRGAGADGAAADGGSNRSKTVEALTSNMRGNMAGLRNRLADTEALSASLKESEVELSLAMGDSAEAQEQLAQFREEMEGDFALLERKQDWQKAIDSFLSAVLGQDKEVPPTTPALADFLCNLLSKAEPSVSPNATALVGWHPADHEMLKVFFATEASELRTGMNIREKTTEPACLDAWHAMGQGEPILSNPHGLERTSKAHRSACPLKSISGITFACLVNGPPCVPDELLEMLGRTAGPLMERIWKQEKVFEAVSNVISFLKQAALDHHQLIYPSFEKGKTVSTAVSREAWAWQPLAHRPQSMYKFELALTWRMGEPIGVLTVGCGTFTKMSEDLIVLLCSMAEALTAAVDEIEQLVPGDTPPLATVQQVLQAYDRMHARIPAMLQDEIHQQLRYFDASKIFAELASFDSKALDDEQKRLLGGVLVLLGQAKRKEFKGDYWKAAVQKRFKKPQVLHEAMTKLPLGDEGGEIVKRWSEAEACTKGIDLDALRDRSPAPVVVLLRWLHTVRMVHRVACALEASSGPVGPNPIADKVFDLIDGNGDGTITSAELVAYLLKEFSSTVAHTLLRVLDTDQSGQIDRQEWRNGWQNGLLSQLLVKEAAKERKAKQIDHEDGARLRSKRSSGVMALTAAAAAEQFREKNPELAKKMDAALGGDTEPLPRGGGGGAGSSAAPPPAQPKGGGKAKLPPLEGGGKKKKKG